MVLPAPFRPASVIRSPASSLKETSANSGLPPTKTSSVVAVAIAIGYGMDPSPLIRPQRSQFVLFAGMDARSLVEYVEAHR